MKRKKSKFAVIAMSLLLGLIFLCGCGKNRGVDAENRDLPEQADMADEPREKSSLKKWEASLSEGTPEAFTAKACRGLSVVRGEVPYFAVSYESRAYKNSFDCWDISVPYQSMVTVDTEAMYAYFQILEDMELVPVDGISREEAGTEKSFNRIFAAYYSGQTEEGGQAEPDRGLTFCFGKQDEEGNYYVEAEGNIYAADKDSVEKLFAVNPYDCILKVVSVVNLETVSKVTIELGDSKYEMQSDGNVFLWNGKTIDSAAYYDLYTQLMSIFIERELTQEEKEKINTQDRELLMRVVYERNRADAPRVTQCYYACDETYASVQVNGTEFFLVSREALGRLKEIISKT